MLNSGFRSGSHSRLVAGKTNGLRGTVWFVLLCLLCSGIMSRPSRRQAAAAVLQSNQQLVLPQREELEPRLAFEPQSFAEMLSASRWTPPMFATITVTTNLDNVNLDGLCSLREAIMAANGNMAMDVCQAGTAGLDTIQFSIGAGTPTINVMAAPLPAITEPVTINGNTGGATRIELNGAGAGPTANGLTVSAGGSTIRNLVINRFGGSGILIQTGAGNTVQTCRIGVNAAGTAALANNEGIRIDGSSGNTLTGNTISGNTQSGVAINNAAAVGNQILSNSIGTDIFALNAIPNGASGITLTGAPSNTIGSAGTHNVISGNQQHGISISNANGNQIIGNFIGVDTDGAAPLGNVMSGVAINNSANTIVGGTAANAGNVISGNGNHGVMIAGAGSTGNILQGNLIGADQAGLMALPNGQDGINIGGASGNTVGGTTAAARNLISGNGDDGVDINGAAAMGNQVQGNFIGVDLTGAASLGNTASGMQIMNAPGNTVGGAAAGAGNVISGNRTNNVFIVGNTASGNQVQGNLIGLNAGGTAAIGGTTDGVVVDSAPSNTIGGQVSAARNTISGHTRFGVNIFGATATGNIIQGNFIGLDSAGTAAIGNSSAGIAVSDTTGTVIGGTASGAGNVISGNGAGIDLFSGTGTQIQGNLVGTNPAGTAAIGNAFEGVNIRNSSANTIGGTTSAARNIASGNGQFGINVTSLGTGGNTVQGNFVGTNAAGTAAIANGAGGVALGAANNALGGVLSGAGNLISGNGDRGVLVGGPAATGNQVQGNFIGVNAAGTAALGNATNGIEIINALNNTIGGTTAAARNIISGNIDNGVRIESTGLPTTGNLVQGNFIGTDASGTGDLGNGSNGVRIRSFAGVTSNTVGGTAAGAGNLISGNGGVGALGSNGVELSGFSATSNIVQGNFIGVNAAGTAALGNSGSGVRIDNASDNTVGGTVSGARNLISGNLQHGVAVSTFADNNLVAGNLIGTDVNGTADLGNTLSGVALFGRTNNTIGGTTAAARNIISGNDQHGVLIQGASDAAFANFVRGNFIGTNAAGTAAIANSQNGVNINESVNNIIGGTAAGAGNVISGNGQNGIAISNGARGNQVQGNLIGTNAAGTGALGNAGFGVSAESSDNTIGGAAAGAGNTIAFNNSAGVAVLATVVNIRISDNAIFGNQGLGIDLLPAGVTPNDAGDPDAGANNLQNFPVINSVSSTGAITGSLDSAPANSTYPVRIEFFGHTACDPSGNGEGEVFLGSTSVAAPGAFSAMVTMVAGKNFITATATDSNGNTSEFSACKQANTAPTITASAPLTRQQGSPAINSQIATVTDPDQPLNTLMVTATPLAGTGVTVNNIVVNAAGVVTADVVASCTATNSTFTLKVTDNTGEMSTTTLTVNVVPNTPPTLGVYPNTGPINTGSNTTVTPNAAPTDNGTVNTLTASAPGFAGTFAGNTTTGVITVTNAGPAGNYTVTVSATDNCGATTTTTFNLFVDTPPTIAAAAPLSRQQGSAATNSQIATVTDPDQPLNTLTVTATPLTGTGVTINNIAVNAAGQVTADVAAACTAINSTFTLKVTDNLMLMNTAVLTVNVTANTPPTLSYASPQTVLAGQNLTVNPATGPSDNGSIASIVVQSMGTYTGGITVNATTGIVSLAGALPPGTHTITIRATDNCGAPSGVTDASFTLNVTCPSITVNPASLPNGTTGVAYSQTISATGGTPAYTFSLSAGSLPTGLSLNPTTGVLSGTPTQANTFNFTIGATDINGCTGTRPYTVAIACPAITVNPPSLPNGTTGTNYSQTISATGGTAPYNFVVTGGALPAGITLATGGALSGAPAQSGTFNFTITATDANGCTGNRAYTLVIACPPFAISINAPAAVSAGQDLSYDVTITNPCPDVALDTTLTTSTPPNTTFQSITAPAGWTCTTPPVGGTGTITCQNTNFLARVTTPRASATFTIVLRVNPATPNGTVITNTVTVTGTAPGRPPVTATASSNTTVGSASDLALTKSGPVNAVSGTTVTYTFNLTNVGPSNAGNVTFSDPLPAGTVFVSNTTPAGFTCTPPPANTNGTVTCTAPALASGASASFTITARLNSNVACNTNITNTATANSSAADPNMANNTSSVTTTAQTQSDLAAGVTAPASAAPDTSVTYTVTLTNNGPSSSFNTTLANALPAAFSAETVTTSAGTCTGVGTNTVNCNLGTLAVGATATVTIKAHVPETCQPTAAVFTATVMSGNCLSDPVAANNSQSKTINVLLGNLGAGACIPAASAISADKPGSIIFIGLAVSGATAGGGGDSNQNNTRLNLTNVHPTLGVAVHLFFVDGATCSVADSFLCLTANQTTSFLMSDLDPGTMGYMLMTAVDGPPGFAGGNNTGCPISFNYLIGNANIKFTSSPRREADLSGESVAAQFGSPAPACDSSSSLAELHFDGSPTGYNQLPRVLALDSIGSRADGNDTILMLARIDGNWATGLQPIGPIFGLLYSDTEVASSFSFNAGTCLFRSPISNNFPRTSPRFEQFIPAGRTGWLKLWAGNEVALLGAAFTRNDNAQTSASAFEGGHNLHILRLLPSAIITVPVFPPSC